ncbi:unnamed protein product, partial [Darwinula stevensoni]
MRERFNRVLEDVINQHQELNERIDGFFHKDLLEKLNRISSYVGGLPQRRKLSSRRDDPDWFQGINERIQTKEEALRARAQSRMRNYLRDARNQTRGDPAALQVHARLLNAFGALQDMLRRDDYQGHLFDRKELESLCDEEGTFACQGRFDLEECSYGEGHVINPYDNRESLLLFQNWNLDHGIERSRTVVPGLVAAIVKGGRRNVNMEYFYALLFTTENLRLVHTVCHEKGHHRRGLDPDEIYL